jgi:hypothetical protein
MTTAPTGENPMNSSDRTGDDLTAIKGISEKRQYRLREEFGICTLQDLATISDEKIESVAKGLRGVSSSTVKGWSVEARKELSSQRVIESAPAEAGEKANSPATEGEWKSVASFVGTFQVRQVKDGTKQRIQVRYLEGDKYWEEEWSGIESEQPWRWILDQLPKKVQQEPEHEEKLQVETQPTATLPVTVEITQIQAFQPPETETPSVIGEAGQPFLGFLRSGEPFALKVCFALAETAAAEVAKRQVTYRAQFYARNLTTRERTLLGDTEPDTLVETQLSYTAVLPEATLQPGMYRLRVLVTLQDVRMVPGYLEVPLLQVV